MIKKADVRNTRHTAPESVKKVKSIKQILVKNKMEAERLSQCWQKTLPKKFKPSWMPVKNGVLWWPELPPSAFVAFNLQKMTYPLFLFATFYISGAVWGDDNENLKLEHWENLTALFWSDFLATNASTDSPSNTKNCFLTPFACINHNDGAWSWLWKPTCFTTNFDPSGQETLRQKCNCFVV